MAKCPGCGAEWLDLAGPSIFECKSYFHDGIIQPSKACLTRQNANLREENRVLSDEINELKEGPAWPSDTK